MSQAKLKLTGTADQHTSERFDRFAWERWFQDEGGMRGLTRVQLAVLMIMLRAANERGESWWGRDKIAERCRCTPQSVTRARGELEKRGLIELVSVGGVQGAHRASRYRIPMRWPSRSTHKHFSSSQTRLDADPDPDAVPGTPAPDAAPGLDAVSGDNGLRPDGYLAREDRLTGGPQAMTEGGAPRHPPLAYTPPDGGAPRHPKSPENNPASSKAGDDGGGAGGPSPFASADAPSAAAAAELLIEFGMPPRIAQDLVHEHTPTADQVRVVIANAEAWEQAHRQGRRKALNNRVGFVRAQIVEKKYNLDPEAEAQQRKKQRDAQLGEEQLQSKRRSEQIEQAFKSLSPKQLGWYKSKVLGDMRSQNPRQAEYCKKYRPQDEPLRSLIAHAAVASSEGESAGVSEGQKNPSDNEHKTYAEWRSLE